MGECWKLASSGNSHPPRIQSSVLFSVSGSSYTTEEMFGKDWICLLELTYGKTEIEKVRLELSGDGLSAS